MSTTGIKGIPNSCLETEIIKLRIIFISEFGTMQKTKKNNTGGKCVENFTSLTSLCTS